MYSLQQYTRQRESRQAHPARHPLSGAPRRSSRLILRSRRYRWSNSRGEAAPKLRLAIVTATNAGILSGWSCVFQIMDDVSKYYLSHLPYMRLRIGDRKAGQRASWTNTIVVWRH
ncbi:MAG TPA: hypothetical protein DDW52_14885 [Planctomycetaceae bacterium]|nr:hypothetical protein [Planctomycetaceae bacterium]